MFEKIKQFRRWIHEVNARVFELQEKADSLTKEVKYLHLQVNNLIKDKYGEDRIAVYTALIGGYDSLNEPEYIDEYADYYCVTDNTELKSDVYTMIYINPEDYEELKGLENDSTRIARFVKIMGPEVLFDEYKYTLFVDANLKIKRSVFEWISTFNSKSDFLTFRHPDRDCIYDEALACIEMNKDKKETIEAQMKELREDNYPEHYGLTMTNVVFRKNTDIIKKIDREWWAWIKKGSRRDQLSLHYVFYKNNFSCDQCYLHAANNEYFEYFKHLK